MANYVSDKFELLQSLVRDKTVLDIGCIQHSWEKSLQSTWVHNILRKTAKSVKGIDILYEDIAKLKDLGYDIEFGNAENFELKDTYSIINSGELIEHLANQGKFLTCCHQHLKPDGKLIITTVNCFSLLFVLLKMFGKLQVNNEHTCWYDEVTLRQLLERFNFKVEQIYYFHSYNTSNNPLKILSSKIFNLLCPYKWRDNIMVVVSKDS